MSTISDVPVYSSATSKHADSYHHPLVVENDYDRQNDAGRKSPRTKYVIIGVSVIAVTLIVTFGFVGAMFAVKDMADKAISSKHVTLRTGNDVIDETIEEYPGDVTQYSVDSPDGRFVVLDDAARRLTVLYDRRICAVAPLSGTDENKQESSPEDTITEDTPKEEVSVKLIHQTIRDHQLLGRHAQRLCDGLPLYWAEIAPKETSGETGRQRRGGFQSESGWRLVRVCLSPSWYRGQMCHTVYRWVD